MEGYVNFGKACGILKISRQTLTKRMAGHGIAPLLGLDKREKLIDRANLPVLRQKQVRPVPAGEQE